MAKIIAPIGKSLGPILNQKKEIESFDLMIGDGIEELTSIEWSTWNAAHAEPSLHNELKVTRDTCKDAVKRESDDSQADDLDQVIDKLITLGALKEFEPTTSEITAFLSQVSVIPTAAAVGSAPEQPEQYRITDGSGDYADIDGWTRDIWALSHREASAWRACELIAEAFTNETPESVATTTFGGLLGLVSMYFGFLEPIE
ncbi:hypothetical protein [Haloglycomyces albus]|uniref:hypothetical protein n=1 Tax=Haloglycomyces albus TaxID=526067 RepID=UPI00046CEA17|nr:hypothetical protein [Haloglycomyces albus]